MTTWMTAGRLRASIRKGVPCTTVAAITVSESLQLPPSRADAESLALGNVTWSARDGTAGGATLVAASWPRAQTMFTPIGDPRCEEPTVRAPT